MLVLTLAWTQAFSSFVLVPHLHVYCLYGTSVILAGVRDVNL